MVPGNVGGTLLDQMAAQAQRLQREFGLDLRIRAIATSTRMHLADRTVDLRDGGTCSEQGMQPLDWARFTRHVKADHLPHAAIIDCSASQDVANRYVEWFQSGIHVVTPNKKAHSGSLAIYDELLAECRRHHTNFLYETTVGAALPVIGTLRDLNQTGDEIVSIEGILSGTLAYLFNVFDGKRAFSAIVREARDKGLHGAGPARRSVGHGFRAQADHPRPGDGHAAGNEGPQGGEPGAERPGGTDRGRIPEWTFPIRWRNARALAGAQARKARC